MVDGITNQKLQEIGFYDEVADQYLWELEEIDGLKVPQIQTRNIYVGEVFNDTLQFDPNLYDDWLGYEAKVREENENKSFREGIEEELIEQKLNQGEYLLHGDHEYDQWIVEKLLDEGILKTKDDDKKGVWVEELKQNVLVPQFEIDETKDDELEEFIDSNYDSLRQVFEYTGYIKSERELFEGRSLREEFIEEITQEEPQWTTHNDAYDMLRYIDKSWYFLGPRDLIDNEDPIIFLSSEYSDDLPFRVVDPENLLIQLTLPEDKYESEYIQDINQEVVEAFKREETKLKEWAGDIKDFKDFEERQMRFSPTVAGSQNTVDEILDDYGISVKDGDNLAVFNEAREQIQYVEDTERLNKWIEYAKAEQKSKRRNFK